MNKPTILLAKKGEELPFDIRSYRVIFYDDTIGENLPLNGVSRSICTQYCRITSQ